MRNEQVPHLVGCKVRIGEHDVGRLMGLDARTEQRNVLIGPTARIKKFDEASVKLWREARPLRGQVVDRTNSDGLSVGEAWYVLFEANEWLFEQDMLKEVRTDEEMAQAMLMLFPDRWQSRVVYQTQRVRGVYNRGELACQEGHLPERRSRRYWRNDDGEARVDLSVSRDGNL